VSATAGLAMHAAAAGARIGPNAIIQCLAALQADLGVARSAALMAQAGLQAHLQRPPQQMVDEDEVVALHRVLRAQLGVAHARALARTAGLKTGDYLLAHRIPALAQRALRLLPARLAGAALLQAVTRHAWTFCGSGVFRVEPAPRPGALRVSITHCITCRGEHADQPLCDCYAATFERLFTAIVHPRTRVTETRCEALGDPACVFDIVWA
jgi:divinyl protochlorophyllide a 8-vinyl-reductase